MIFICGKTEKVFCRDISISLSRANNRDILINVILLGFGCYYLLCYRLELYERPQKGNT